jgi:hypothetical protein
MRHRFEEASMATAPEPIHDEQIDDGVRFLDDDEARELFDREARRLLGISGEEFLRRYDAGEYNRPLEDPEEENLMLMLMSLDLVR